MATARVISVNVGRGRDAAWAGRLRRTAIDKRPMAGPAKVAWLGLEGDERHPLRKRFRGAGLRGVSRAGHAPSR